MKEIMTLLKAHGFDFREMDALEVFARTGDQTVDFYIDHVRYVRALDVNPVYVQMLREKYWAEEGTGKIDIVCADAIDYLRRRSRDRRFALACLDNPQGIYGLGYCEHFDALQAVLPWLTSKALLTFVCNTNPFDPREVVGKSKDDYGMRGAQIDAWFDRRRMFYGSNRMELDDMLSWYRRFFAGAGFDATVQAYESLPPASVDWPVHIYRVAFYLEQK